MTRVEDIIDYRGRLRSKPINKVSKKQRKKNADLAKIKREKWDEAREFGGWPICGLCGLHIYNYETCDLDHKVPRRRGGDERENLHLTHHAGNVAKGSIKWARYLELPLAIRGRNCGFNHLQPLEDRA